MIRIQTSKSTGKVIHTDAQGKTTEVTELPLKASLKAILARVKAMGLKDKEAL